VLPAFVAIEGAISIDFHILCEAPAGAAGAASFGGAPPHRFEKRSEAEQTTTLPNNREKPADSSRRRPSERAKQEVFRKATI
jgi:hypothetical protein